MRCSTKDFFTCSDRIPLICTVTNLINLIAKPLFKIFNISILQRDSYSAFLRQKSSWTIIQDLTTLPAVYKICALFYQKKPQCLDPLIIKIQYQKPVQTPHSKDQTLAVGASAFKAQPPEYNVDDNPGTPHASASRSPTATDPRIGSTPRYVDRGTQPDEQLSPIHDPLIHELQLDTHSHSQAKSSLPATPIHSSAQGRKIALLKKLALSALKHLHKNATRESTPQTPITTLRASTPPPKETTCESSELQTPHSQDKSSLPAKPIHPSTQNKRIALLKKLALSAVKYQHQRAAFKPTPQTPRLQAKRSLSTTPSHPSTQDRKIGLLQKARFKLTPETPMVTMPLSTPELSDLAKTVSPEVMAAFIANLNQTRDKPTYRSSIKPKIPRSILKKAHQTLSAQRLGFLEQTLSSRQKVRPSLRWDPLTQGRTPSALTDKHNKTVSPRALGFLDETTSYSPTQRLSTRKNRTLLANQTLSPGALIEALNFLNESGTPLPRRAQSLQNDLADLAKQGRRDSSKWRSSWPDSFRLDTTTTPSKGALFSTPPPPGTRAQLSPIASDDGQESPCDIVDPLKAQKALLRTLSYEAAALVKAKFHPDSTTRRSLGAPVETGAKKPKTPAHLSSITPERLALISQGENFSQTEVKAIQQALEDQEDRSHLKSYRDAITAHLTGLSPRNREEPWEVCRERFLAERDAIAVHYHIHPGILSPQYLLMQKRQAIRAATAFIAEVNLRQLVETNPDLATKVARESPSSRTQKPSGST